MEILSIIPARGGSKGIKRKNIKLINNKPLIAYSIEASLNSKYITKTILSSEDDEILEVAQKYGAEISKRPIELAQDETKTAPVMLQVIEELETIRCKNIAKKITSKTKAPAKKKKIIGEM